MFLRLGTNDVDVFQAHRAVNAQVAQVCAEETKTFTAEKNRDQREHDNGDERVAAKEKLNAALDQSARAARFALLSSQWQDGCDNFHNGMMRTRRGIGKKFTVTIV